MPRKKRKRKSLARDITGFTGAGVGLGVGTLVASQAGAPSGVMSGFGVAGGMMPAVGLGIMGGHALGGLRRIQKRKRRKVRGY